MLSQGDVSNDAALAASEEAGYDSPEAEQDTFHQRSRFDEEGPVQVLRGERPECSLMLLAFLEDRWAEWSRDEDHCWGTCRRMLLILQSQEFAVGLCSSS